MNPSSPQECCWTQGYWLDSRAHWDKLEKGITSGKQRPRHPSGEGSVDRTYFPWWPSCLALSCKAHSWAKCGFTVALVIFFFFLFNIYSFHWTGSSLWHMGSSHWGTKDLVPWPGIEFRPPTLGAQDLSHWPPGKSHLYHLLPPTFQFLSTVLSDHFLLYFLPHQYLIPVGTCSALTPLSPCASPSGLQPPSTSNPHDTV